MNLLICILLSRQQSKFNENDLVFDGSYLKASGLTNVQQFICGFVDLCILVAKTVKTNCVRL